MRLKRGLLILSASVAAVHGVITDSVRGAEFRLLSWETIENTCPGGPSEHWRDCTYTERLNVPGGWLVRSTRLVREPSFVIVPPGLPAAGNTLPTGGGLGAGVGLTFLPDPNHAWNPKQ
jgi:hypothetical protein